MEQAQTESYVFIGLGNPGRQYEMTRHNMGYLVVEAFARSLGWIFKEDRRFNARVVKGASGNKTVHLVLPLTYMNLSGTAVRRYVDYYKIPLNHLVVVVDDIALSFGQLRLRAMGSAGGHNGLKSIEACLGTNHYMRLRMGIGHPGEKVLADYVLDPFSSADKEELPAFIDKGVGIMQRLLTESPSHVMNAVNTVPKQVKEETLPGKERKDITKAPLQGEEKKDE